MFSKNVGNLEKYLGGNSPKEGGLNFTVEAAYQGRHLTGAKVLYYMEHVLYYSNCYYLPKYYNFKT